MLQAPPATSFLAAPTWRREPYRLLFPLGAALGVAGVLPWLLFGVGGAWAACVDGLAWGLEWAAS